MNYRLISSIILILFLSQSHAITIGTSANYPPFSSRIDKNNHFVGFDIDIMQAICQRINIPCTFTPVSVQNLKTQLLMKKIDVAIAAIIIPEQEPTDVLYSMPYLKSYAQFVVLQQSKIQAINNIQYKVIGTRGGDFFKDLLVKQFGEKLKIIDYPTLHDLIHALLHRDVDIIFANEAAVHYWVASSKGKYRAVGNKIAIGNGYGIMTTKDKTPLIQAINQAIRDMMSDGSYAMIYSRYFKEE